MNPEDHADPELIETASGLANPSGIKAYGLELPAKALELRLQPLRKRLSGPETHAERMARTDRQLEEDRRQRELNERLAGMEAEWAQARADCNGEDCMVGIVVLDLHFPVLDNSVVTCNECCQCDYSGEAIVEWPCNTFREIKRLVL